MASADPIEGFVYMEFYNMQQLMERIHETLEGIGSVLYSSGLLTSSIEKDATVLLKSKIHAYHVSHRRGADEVDRDMGRTADLAAIYQGVRAQG